MLENNNALYVYGIVKCSFHLYWGRVGISGENVYAVNKGNFSALVHECEEKPYLSEEPNKIKELIITHNNVLERAMEEFAGVIPLHFNTIIKRTDGSPEFNLRKWLNENKERLEGIWNRIQGKKEYGIRIYYDKNKLIKEATNNEEITQIEKSREGKAQGLSYLLQEKSKFKINEVLYNRINQLKQKFYDDISKITNEIIVNLARASIKEEKDLLISLSVLIENQQAIDINKILEKNSSGFPYQIVGPFAPYSFVENET